MTNDTDEFKRRAIRSFVKREGRITRGQQLALDTLWPVYGIDYQPRALPLDIEFARQAPRVLEIGFGNGEALCDIARIQPETDYLGIEVHRPGVGHLLRQIQQHQLTNVRVMAHDAVEVLHHMLTPDSLDRVHIFFPDPWHKKRHHKRRLIQAPFLDLLATRLKPGGVIHLATDWEPYAEHMLDVLMAHPDYRNTVNGTDLNTACVPRPEARPLTKFERRGQRKGHGVWDLIFTLCVPAVKNSL